MFTTRYTSRRGAHFAGFVFGCSIAAGLSVAYADEAVQLPFDTPTMIDGIETVCTGIGQDSRADPRWNAYPLKVVLAGEGGQYLGEAQVNVAAEGETMMDVRCGGPWVLFKLEPGRYAITAKINGNVAKSIAYVSAKGQGRIILRFPAVGGVVSAEHVPPMEASGTSGMKAAFNGVPSLSVADGWWIEGCIEGLTGWSIEGASSLYDKLERLVLPLFYGNKDKPGGWTEVMKGAIGKNAMYFNSHRMMRRYATEAYLR